MMRASRYRFAWFLLGCLWAFAAQAADPAPSLRVVVDGKTTVFDHAALAALPQAKITAAVHDEKPSVWSGVALADVLRKAGALDKPLRGKSLALFVRVTATDHYQAVFALAELDPLIEGRTVLLADAHDGQPLAADGPFRLVVPEDKRAARWVHGIVSVEVVDGAAP
ncbi:molybdopterin-dependent oxidoreductase [Dyella sp. LX-66]|uniref:molybdopterin-dependent oxidoreductase n=1 Tax=unclassified Dyella TaxID=2634549 RepID=UPI001BE037B9|nr:MULTISPECIES: molybdopterin-dependent oxidoreductase [unclassified Dyella]MBT2116548.1 molybdopterin-dependent oxidoreductase [Dyella sp. LX-1]MBT2140509.1 molybdopterin-dependent oxidoreductase [Dyella sp. LX-66]